MPPTIAVVGATGLLGRHVLNSLLDNDVEPEQVRCFASERSDGSEVDYGDDSLPVECLGPGAFRGVAAAILAVPPAVARTTAAQAQQQGVWAVDVSGAHRASVQVPLVAPGVNDSAVAGAFSGRVVSLAQPSTQALGVVLEPLRRKYGLLFADATVLCGASARGRQGVECLSTQTTSLLNGKDPTLDVFPHRLAFNIIPEDGDFEGAVCASERALAVEASRLWEPFALTTTSLQVPTFHGVMLVISAHLREGADVAALRQTLRESKSLKVIDEPDQHIYPMPLLVIDDAAVHVGRLRVLGPRLQLVAAIDGAHRTAVSAVELALRLAARS